MKTDTAGKSPRKETGLRIPQDQIDQLDLLVKINKGRRKRSSFICEAIDEYLASRLSKLCGT